MLECFTLTLFVRVFHETNIVADQNIRTGGGVRTCHVNDTYTSWQPRPTGGGRGGSHLAALVCSEESWTEDQRVRCKPRESVGVFWAWLSTRVHRCHTRFPLWRCNFALQAQHSCHVLFFQVNFHSYSCNACSWTEKMEEILKFTV